ncbi:HesA/MoeB/ThiF family protein [Olivibacter sp. XZL3]|uniref:HesA/MoeB/ThiF family protein n=1 Tax=Olivibacter sp. XZL3 TaxID=1735116 RepID=UPI001064BA5E|nr:HesA/MoeB/ThiF family protein [Olivibacter sp. XZL3]
MDRAYYDRQIKLTGFGEIAQQKLSQAKVLVIGAGGLGCPILQYLATAGIGHIGVIDGDVVALHNLHRQILFSREDIGLPKVAVVVNKIKQLQPAIQLTSYPFSLTAENALDIISSYDLVVDGSDNFSTRYLVNDACVIADKAFVSGAVNDYTGQVSVFNYKEGPTYRCLYPDSPEPEYCHSCSINGILNVLPGIIGLFMANEVIKIITDYGNPLSGKLLTIDIQKNLYQTISFNRDLKNKEITTLNKHQSIMSGREALINQRLNPGTLLVDVREDWEFEEKNIGGINIPLYELPQRMAEIDGGQPIIFLCQTGLKSRQAAALFKNGNQPVMIAKLD